MREPAEETKRRIEFIMANPDMTLTEMARALGVHRDKIVAHCYYHDLPYKCAIKVAKHRKQESEFFNVHSHSDWMVGKY